VPSLLSKAILPFLLSHEKFEQIQADMHECIKFEILLFPKSKIKVVLIHLKQFMPNFPNRHKKLNSYMIPRILMCL
jgi:hypothetical protein